MVETHENANRTGIRAKTIVAAQQFFKLNSKLYQISLMSIYLELFEAAHRATIKNTPLGLQPR